MEKGMKVTLKAGAAPRPAWYSGYGMNPVFSDFTHGVVGTVGAVKVPKVRGPKNPPPGWCPYYVCVDYICTLTGEQVRTSVEYADLEVIHEKQRV